ncbi:uncharacterized protein DS421_10g307490 [Arachis hypogaea]|nr:uncharacterized protein DS421_10g307490 [Arachis hypogaea]
MMGSSNASGEKKVKFQHPKCKYGSYTIMQGSATAKNSDRIFDKPLFYGLQCV